MSELELKSPLFVIVSVTLKVATVDTRGSGQVNCASANRSTYFVDIRFSQLDEVNFNMIFKRVFLQCF
jgi:hypothetical protein